MDTTRESGALEDDAREDDADGTTADGALAAQVCESDGDTTSWLEHAEDLVAVGGSLDPERLLEAYRCGIFPWYEDGSPILWWSPDPRAVLELDALHVSRRLRRRLRRGEFRLGFDTACPAVIRECARDRAEGTWITAEMLDAYTRLHEAGHVHSVEAWQGDRLVGGVYGIAIGGFFAGESMFHRVPDASKAALCGLVEHLRARGFALLDLQILNDHTRTLGAIEIPRREYFRRLRRAREIDVRF